MRGHGVKEIGGGFMFGFLELVEPVTAEAVTDPTKQAHDVDRRPSAATALSVVVGDIQSSVQAVFNGPVLAIVFQPSTRIELAAGQAGDQSDGFGLVLAQFAVDQRHLCRVKKADVFGSDFPRA